MGRPVILVVDDDEPMRAALMDALRRRYAAEYAVVEERSAERALAALGELRERGQRVACVIADQHMPEMSGIDVLLCVHELHRDARRALLLDVFDRGAFQRLAQEMTLGRIDSWLIKPWDPAEQFLYPRVGELLADWTEATSQGGFVAVRLVAEPWHPRVHEMRDLLHRNGIPTEVVTPESPHGRTVLERAGLGRDRLPAVVFFDGRVLANPSDAQVAQALHVATRAPADRYDLVVLGAGPAGLSAAVYGASEGLHTVMVDPAGVGGQAGTSSRIRNYLGFPRGVSGRTLASLAGDQSTLFGAEFVFNHATGLRRLGDDLVVTLSDATEVVSRAVVISTGVDYRRLDAPGTDDLLGAGVFYGAAVSEARAVAGQPVVVVGAGNSAGQAAVHLARHADQVTVLVRGPRLSSTMSDYLIREMAAIPNIDIRLNTTVVEVGGPGRLQHLSVRDAGTGRIETLPAAGLFILIGTEPRTDWLQPVLARDETGFLLTGPDLSSGADDGHRWPLQRSPLPLETSLPGVFAAGDVRHGSVKRVASAVGDGAIAVQHVHQYLADNHGA
jgi:thioredoxin reductase (NADPH)